MPAKIEPAQQPGRTEFILLVTALMTLNSLAMDIMPPALPDIDKNLNMQQQNNRSLVLTFFSIGFGCTQIIFGTIGDRFGRRIPLFIGLTLYISIYGGRGTLHYNLASLPPARNFGAK